MKGAEAVVTNSMLIGRKTIIKNRIRKGYRISEIDEKLRRERTRREARLLHKAKLAGVNCPAVLEVSEFILVLERVRGKSKINKKVAYNAGVILSKLHTADIIHGDYTPANLLYDGKELTVIDFGLGFFSSNIEDKAIDVVTILKSMPYEKEFLKGYKVYAKFKEVMKRVEVIKTRVRYAYIKPKMKPKR